MEVPNKKPKKLPEDDFSNMETEFEKMHKQMEEVVSRMHAQINIDFQQLSNDPNTRVHGFSIRIGPEGKPVIHEFGNVKAASVEKAESPTKQINEREPLVDVIEGKNEVRVLAEIPGAEEKEIQLHYVDSKLEIKIDHPNRKYYKQLMIPTSISYSKKKVHYKNGVLEIVFPKKNI